jgi:hypothetical protein
VDLYFRCTCGQLLTLAFEQRGSRGCCPTCAAIVRAPGERLAEPIWRRPLPTLQAPCSSCGQLVRAQARKCRHCGELLSLDALDGLELETTARTRGNDALIGNEAGLLAAAAVLALVPFGAVLGLILAHRAHARVVAAGHSRLLSLAVLITNYLFLLLYLAILAAI